MDGSRCYKPGKMNIKIKKNTIIQAYIFFTCLVSFTKSYVFLAYLLGTSVAVITSLFFVSNVILIFYLQRNLYKWKTIAVFGIHIILLPILVSLLNFDASITALLLQLFYMSQLLLGAVAIISYDKSIQWAVIGAVLINLIVGLFSVINPAFFEPLSIINDSSSFFHGRAIGFFLQPNTFGAATVVLLIISNVLCKKWFPLLYPLLMITVFITFSRTAIALFIIISFIIFVFQVYQNGFNFNKYLKAVMTLGLVILVAFGTLMISPYGALISNFQSYERLYSRIQFFLELDSETVTTSGSWQERVHYQSFYIENIPSTFVNGNGIGTQSEAIEEGELAGSAHNLHLDLLYQGGFFYWFSFMLILFNIIYIAWKNKLKNTFKASFAIQLFIFIFLLSFFSSWVLQMRELLIVLGMLIQFKDPDYFRIFINT